MAHLPGSGGVYSFNAAHVEGNVYTEMRNQSSALSVANTVWRNGTATTPAQTTYAAQQTPMDATWLGACSESGTFVAFNGAVAFFKIGDVARSHPTRVMARPPRALPKAPVKRAIGYAKPKTMAPVAGGHHLVMNAHDDLDSQFETF